MKAERDGVVRVQLLLDALFLEGISTAGAIGHSALQWVTEWLGLDPEAHFGVQTLTYLVAVQLAPRPALDYQLSNPRPRWRLIDDYLRERFDLEQEESARIARLIATVLDDAALERGPHLISVEGVRSCAICRLPFGMVPTSVTTRDPYKPMWLAPAELCRPEVDHVIPISGVGTHSESNMQVVCRACNLAKGNGLTIDPMVEVRYAGRELDEVPRVHIFRLLQWLIQSRGGQCQGCGSASEELTMRPIHPEAPLARATMVLRCYNCVGDTLPNVPQHSGTLEYDHEDDQK